MDENLLEIREYNGEGYQPLVDYGAWRVAILRYIDELMPERIETLERHVETDEVFVLLHGRGVLLLGGNGARVAGIAPLTMDSGKIYNVKCNTWHSILLSRETSVLLVENRNTGQPNTEYARLTLEQRKAILEIAKQYPETLVGDESF
jgi:ureidoglycolate hydrolase